VVWLTKHSRASTCPLDAIAEEDLLTAVKHHTSVPHTLNLHMQAGQEGKQGSWLTKGRLRDGDVHMHHMQLRNAVT
jgi:hypothetical protein